MVRGTAFARHLATALLLKKRRRAEYRLPPHSLLIIDAPEHLEPAQDGGLGHADGILRADFVAATATDTALRVQSRNGCVGG